MQRAAVEVGARADVVRLVVERVAERGAHEPQLADRTLRDERCEPYASADGVAT